ncbi:hypothetical protein, partial [Paraburkholderia humisilvae]
NFIMARRCRLAASAAASGRGSPFHSLDEEGHDVADDPRSYFPRFRDAALPPFGMHHPIIVTQGNRQFPGD